MRTYSFPGEFPEVRVLRNGDNIRGLAIVELGRSIVRDRGYLIWTFRKTFKPSNPLYIYKLLTSGLAIDANLGPFYSIEEARNKIKTDFPEFAKEETT